MSDPVLNSMLHVAPPPRPGARPAADQAGSDSAVGADSFAQALGRRLESADRPAFRPTREQASTKTAEGARQRGDATGTGPAKETTAPGSPTDPADDSTSEGLENTARATEAGPGSAANGAESQSAVVPAATAVVTPTDIAALKATDVAVMTTASVATGSPATKPPTAGPQMRPDVELDTTNPAATPVTTGLPTSVIAAGLLDGTDETGREAAPVPATTATDNPAVAASIAVLLQGIAATLPGVTPPADTATETDTPPLLLSGDMPVTSAQGSGATKLERLIAQVGDRSATRPDPAGGGLDLRTGAIAILDHKTSDTAAASDTAPNYAVTRLQDSLPTAPTATGTQPHPASTLQPGHPELQAASLQGSALSSAPRSEAVQTPQLPVHTPAGQAAWAEDVGNRVVWMFGRQESRAELVLTPAHLGKLEVSIQVNGDQTTAQFVAASAAARDALEQALPRLREVLQQAGINLGQTNVSTSGDQRARQDGGTGTARQGRDGGGDDTSGGLVAADTGIARWTAAGRGIVDTFA